MASGSPHNAGVSDQDEGMGLPRWYRRTVLALQMYAFLIVFVFVITTPGWRMVLWLVAGLGIQMGMLTLASLTDPKRGR